MFGEAIIRQRTIPRLPSSNAEHVFGEAIIRQPGDRE